MQLGCRCAIRSFAMMTCPLCRSGCIHQSRRKGIFEKTILAMIFVRPFRCERCDSRFFRWSFSTNPNAPRAAATH